MTAGLSVKLDQPLSPSADTDHECVSKRPSTEPTDLKKTWDCVTVRYINCNIKMSATHCATDTVLSQSLYFSRNS